MFKIKDKIYCNRNNPKFFKMLVSFEILLAYSLFLIKNHESKGVYQFYNYIFEQYLPEKVVNLDKIEYRNIFLGDYADATITIYKNLLSLWVLLQEKTILDSTDLATLEKTYKLVVKTIREVG